MTIYDKVDFSPLRSNSRRKSHSLNNIKKIPKLLAGMHRAKSHQIWCIFILKCQNNCPNWVTDLGPY